MLWTACTGCPDSLCCCSPKEVQRSQAHLRLTVVDNQYEDSVVQMVGEGYQDDITIDNVRSLDTYTDVEELEGNMADDDVMAAKDNVLKLGDCYIGQEKATTVTLTNHHVTDCFRFQWPDHPNLTFKPKVRESCLLQTILRATSGSAMLTILFRSVTCMPAATRRSAWPSRRRSQYRWRRARFLRASVASRSTSPWTRCRTGTTVCASCAGSTPCRNRSPSRLPQAAAGARTRPPLAQRTYRS